MQAGTTPDPGYQWESNKLTVRHHKREPTSPHFKSSKDRTIESSKTESPLQLLTLVC